MKESRLTYLFHAYFNKSATLKEREELMELISLGKKDQEVKDLLTETWQKFNSENELFSQAEGEKMLSEILQDRNGNRTATVISIDKPGFRWSRIVAAAAILFCAITAIYFWSTSHNQVDSLVRSDKRKQVYKDAILPGGNKAVLTLSDGTNILLDTTHEGALANQGNTKVMRLNKTTLAYNADKENDLEIVYNTLSTPQGGVYQLILPDGTKVWLNASSSIHFPTVFKGNERNVTVTGEAYFEVAKNAAMPFIINVKDVEVKVLGTHFNIMAYDNESSINTTLLEGAVKVSKGSLNKMLVPGQESRIYKTGDIKVVEADIEEVMAWKNGWFEFNEYDIEKVMRQIARWYNVEIVYEGKIPTGHFSGLVSRANDISEVLKIISAGGVQLKMEGRKVIIKS